MNVYSDETHTAALLLAEEAASLLPFIYMGGDFNIHSQEWDGGHRDHPGVATQLLNTAVELGLQRAPFVNPGPPFYPRIQGFRSTVIDLVFVQPDQTLTAQVTQLWDALHNTYNSASDRAFNINILNSIPDMPVRGWVPFSALEMREALASCSNVSAPGPDHIKWSHLKMLMRGPTHVFTILLALANACLRFFPSLNHEVLMAILRKLGFSNNVVKFFSHYLVGRSMQYAWGDFISDLRQADVGVRQGSALSPVLSALYLTLIMRLFELDPLTRGCFLLSYVDDGTLVVQSKSLLNNCEALKRTYGVIFELFKKFGLALEHDKSEVFHFDRSHSKDNPPVDLGYAPYTGVTPLKPKLYWRYLGFYFDRKLTFTEHVRYYSTKALATVKAMKMLGSSTRGLRPVQKRILYCACVLPIVTYGFRLWYFAAARCKGALHHLSTMQRNPALWITGAFRTSPTGGVEALAGLPPINLLLRHLSERADYRFATLTPTHPVRAFLSRFNCGTIVPHPTLSIQTMSEPEIFRTSGTLFESNTNVLALTETLLPMNLLSKLGVRLMDRFVDQVHFDVCKISCGHADKELKQRTKHLDKLCDKILENIGTYYAGTDASLPLSGRYQAIAASILFSGRVERWRTRHVAGKVTAPDAELYAIRSAIVNATSRDDCTDIFIFTDSMASARRAVDPSIHSGQGHSVAVCEALQTWFTRKDGQSITFVYVPSRLQWDLHYKAHEYATKLKVALGPRPATSFDSLHMQAALSRGTSWNVLFQDPEYQGRNFLQLKTVDGAVAQPGGKDNPWVHFANMSSPQLYARMCRCILNHAPIGSYYSRFNLNDGHTLCPCGCPWETRTHILTCKRTYCPPRTCELKQPTTLCYLHSFWR
ncbi:hypothetical protein CVT25_010605 [Psilocybe cyanescens]|uniref:Reverse transcriptase domain-containing protein n=1 Tax=Psilocybe cyanescens TaxID=93625 RepID=A0A409XV67_PSICY|nr:hypothetical protein CVT25_010605 [Psilocybe cyanescens]